MLFLPLKSLVDEEFGDNGDRSLWVEGDSGIDPPLEAIFLLVEGVITIDPIWVDQA